MEKPGGQVVFKNNFDKLDTKKLRLCNTKKNHFN